MYTSQILYRLRPPQRSISLSAVISRQLQVQTIRCFGRAKKISPSSTRGALLEFDKYLRIRISALFYPFTVLFVLPDRLCFEAKLIKRLEFFIFTAAPEILWRYKREEKSARMPPVRVGNEKRDRRHDKTA